MPRRPDTIETTRLVIELLRLIPRFPGKIMAKDLFEALQDTDIKRDLRTIQRLLDSLSQHFPIERDERDRAAGYGYSWMSSANGLVAPSLTPQESLLLELAEKHLRNLLPARLMKSMGSFFEQARRNLGADSNARREREWRNKVRVVANQPLLAPKIDPAVFEAVSEALYDNQWLSISYYNRAGEQKEDKEVMPLGLVQQGPNLYLVCRFQGYDNERNLALHRIRSARKTTLSFDRPKDFDLQKYDDEGRFGYGDGKKIRLTFHIRKSAGIHLLETRLSTDQTVKELEDSYEIGATVVDSKILEWWLRGFGEDVWEVRRETL